MTTTQRLPNPNSDGVSDADLAEWADWEKWQDQAEWQDIAEAGRIDESESIGPDGAGEDPQWLDRMPRQLRRRGLGSDR